MSIFQGFVFDCKTCRIEILDGARVLNFESADRYTNTLEVKFFIREPDMCPLSYTIYDDDVVKCKGCATNLGLISNEYWHKTWRESTGVRIFHIESAQLLTYERRVSKFSNFQKELTLKFLTNVEF